ncbi:MAG: glycerol-3-phosphate dehydrogenase [Ideonella sp.]|nr:glycerol-3-phosphate dehydrogenase [Ideonella sp.]MCC7458772.1 glycerol-3-phosphate dehydrogenase [Nitrospira sp.]
MSAAGSTGAPATDTATCDVLVVGGGINGAGIARDLAGRGLAVWLCEKDDLAQHTSSSSTKLIHGGLRYLEYYEFSLVRKALAERERLLKSAPHIMRPLRFVMPHDPSMRPVWMIRAGLFLYDHLARREWLPGSQAVALATHPAGAPLKPRYTRGFVYSDGWVDDARLVVLNAVDAAARGAAVLTRCRCERAERSASGWLALLRGADGRTRTVRARALVNATGPWAAQFLREHANIAVPKTLRLIKGSHIVVRRLFDHPFAYIFQNADRRIIFAIPYEGEFTLIGTTDVETQAPIGEARIDADETRYLCEQASRYFAREVTPADVVWSYAGVRPLLDEAGDAASVTRDYLLELDTSGAPLLNVWGGKITTFRKLAEEAAALLREPLRIAGAPWTATAPLPGGDLSAWITPSGRPDRDIAAFDAELARRQPQLATALRERWVHSYGSRVALLLAQPIGAEVAPHLHEGELRYLRDQEWARSADDVLWRRSKLGLHYGAADREQVQRWWRQRGGAAVTGTAAAATAAE